MLTNEQKIKALLVILSEYLQCPPLSDAQVKLYAAELGDLGPEGLRKAIAALKADETVWAGRFPLPAKIRSYLQGGTEDRALKSALKVVSMADKGSGGLTPMEWRIKNEYGNATIEYRNASNTPTIIAQLRDLFRSAYAEAEREKALTLPAPVEHVEEPVLIRTFDEAEG